MAGPLVGIRVVDLATTLTGPTATRYLADYGATVVRVETTRHPDTLRYSGPFGAGLATVDSSGYYAAFNTGKYSIALDLDQPGGRELFARLVRWADILVESFTPRVMRRWGLDYRALSDIKPDLIMASTCQQGQTGPRAEYAGYGYHGAALAGLNELTGWPDREPVGPYSAYTDFTGWGFLLVGLLAALDYRRRTGHGMYIDQSQYESALQFLGPALLDYLANGKVAARNGNRDAVFVPNGVYPCASVAERPSEAGEWVAVTVRSDDEWRGLCRGMGRADWSQDPSLGTVAGRRGREGAIDDGIAAWTSARPRAEVCAALRKHGVVCEEVLSPAELLEDAQLLHREHFRRLEHPVLGGYLCHTSCFRLSATPAEVGRRAARLGEDTEHVLRDFLGIGEAELARYAAAGVFT